MAGVFIHTSPSLSITASIGFECCRLLASLPNVHCILTARDKGRGTKARDELIASGAKNVSFMQLDISDKDRCVCMRGYSHLSYVCITPNILSLSLPLSRFVQCQEL